MTTFSSQPIAHSATLNHSNLNKGATIEPQLDTQIVHAPQADATGFHSMPTPVYRGSSTFFSNTASQRAPINPMGLDYSYGLHGNPTQFTLCQRLAALEGAQHALVVPSGLSAIYTLATACLQTGDHWLIPANVYGPVIQMAEALQARFSIAFDLYNPLNVADLAAHIQPTTRLIWTEAPGSLTFEVPDLKAIVALAKQHGILTGLDNTWSAGLTLKSFELGMDYSVQALTKYQCGHADVLMGAILGNHTPTFRAIEHQNRLTGLGVSPADCDLILRGLLTLPVRYRAQADSALQLAHTLQQHPAVHRVLHPALPSCPGHEHWKTLFNGAASLFAVQLKNHISDAQACAWIDGLQWFKIAYSWGGPESLALVVNIPEDRRAVLDTTAPGGGPIVRLAIGLEHVTDLEKDLIEGLNTVC